MPEKPVIDVCINTIKDTLENSFALCPAEKSLLDAIKKSKLNSFYKQDVIDIFEEALKNNTEKNPKVEIPLKYTDNWVMQSPDAFGRLLTYLKQLEKRLKEEYENFVNEI